MKMNEIFQDKILTLSNCLSLLRIVAAPFIGYFIYREHISGDTDWRYYELGGIMVIVISDFFDGFLARLLHQESKLGQFLDPMADKLSAMMVGVFLVLFKGFPLWLWVLAFSREVLAVIVAYVMYTRVDHQVKPNIFGKLCATSLALSCLIFTLSIDVTIGGITLKNLTVYLIVLFYILGGILYIKSYVPHIKKSS